MHHAKSITQFVAITAIALSAFGGAPVSAAENPMDDVGLQHNMYLECLQSTGGSVEDSLRRLVEKCGYAQSMPLDEFVKTYQPVIELDPGLTLVEKMASEQSRFTKYEFSFFSRIDDVVATAADPDQADAMFAKLEQEAIATLDPRTRNGANILGSLSTARHSLRYWVKHGAGADPVATGKMRWWKWLLVAAADAAGYALTENIGTAASASETAYNYLNSP